MADFFDVLKRLPADAITTAITTEPVAVLRPQPHGGALRNGGPNKGGKGATPSAVRKACRKAFAKRLPDLAKIADNEDPNALKERLKALDMLGRFGLSGAVTWDDIRGRLKAQLALLRQYVPPEQLEPLLAELAQIWR